MRTKIYILLFVTAILIITTSATMTPGVGEPWGMWDATGNPDHIGVGNCSGCHAGPVNNSDGSLTIVVKDDKGLPVSGYAFNKTYTVDVTVAKTGVSTFGFDTEIVTAANTDAGTITATDTVATHTMQGAMSTNITHSEPATTTGSHTFSFSWKSPAADSGVVTIYAAGLAANGNGKNTGDYTYTNIKKLSVVANVHEYEKEISGLIIYPNPVSTSCNIYYKLKKSGHVSINLYTINGRRISSISDGEKSYGLQQELISLPASISDGVYLLQLNTNGSSAFEKIIVRK